MLRELQQKNNCGECSHLNFSLYSTEIGNAVAGIFRDILASKIKCLTALAIYKNNLILRVSYEGVDFPGQVASASLKRR